MRPTLERRVARYCGRHGLLPPGAPVLAMVSGGADSLCLMHLLAALHDGPVGVLSIDHGLRPEAADEADAVAAAAAALGLPAHVARLRLPRGSGAAERARDARLAAAQALAAREGYRRIATGHTRDDQAETVLLRIARGTGRTGALGMAPRRGPFVRPLLEVDAVETRRFCAERGLRPAEDPGNADPASARARVRHGALPALAAVHGGAARHAAAFADLLRDEAEVLAPVLAEAWRRCDGGRGLDVAALAGEPPALARLLVRRLLEEAGLPADARGAEPVARVLATLPSARAVALPGGWAAHCRGRLHAGRHGAPAARPLPVPGRAAFGDVGVRAAPGVAEPPRPERVALRVEGPLEVRGPRAGDRVPLPQGGRVAVGRLLAAAGVPAPARPRVPVVVRGDRVLWVAGHRAAPDALAAPGEPATVLDLVPAEAP